MMSIITHRGFGISLYFLEQMTGKICRSQPMNMRMQKNVFCIYQLTRKQRKEIVEKKKTTKLRPTLGPNLTRTPFGVFLR